MEALISSIQSQCRPWLILSGELDGLTADQVAHVMGEIKKNTNIEWLYLSRNYLSSDAVCAVAEYMKCATKLTDLAIDWNCSRGTRRTCTFDIRGTRAIADAIKANTRLEVVSIEHNKLSATDFYTIVDAVKTSRSISAMYLSGNQDVGYAGARKIASLIYENAYIRRIRIYVMGLVSTAFGQSWMRWSQTVP